MGLFGSKPNDSKARIEELKKKIQAEQAALSSDGVTPPPPPISSPPPMPTQQPVQHIAPPVSIYQQPPPMPERTVERPEPHRHVHVEEILEEEQEMDELNTGIVLDLGDGMSLNLPIKSRMRLDEFLHIADKVRDLQKIQHY